VAGGGGEETAATPEALLRLDAVEVVYDHVISVLQGVSIAVPEGGIVALLGPNGAGKSTTLKAVSNLSIRRSTRLATASWFSLRR